MFDFKQLLVDSGIIVHWSEAGVEDPIPITGVSNGVDLILQGDWYQPRPGGARINAASVLF